MTNPDHGELLWRNQNPVPSKEEKCHPSPQALSLQTMLSASPARTSLQTTSSRRAQRVQGPKQTSMHCLSEGSLWCATSVWFWLECLPPWAAPHVHVPPGHGHALLHYAATAPTRMHAVTWVIPRTWRSRKWEGANMLRGHKQCLTWWPGWRGRPVGRSLGWGHIITPCLAIMDRGVGPKLHPTHAAHVRGSYEIFGIQYASTRIKTVHISLCYSSFTGDLF